MYNGAPTHLGQGVALALGANEQPRADHVAFGRRRGPEAPPVPSEVGLVAVASVILERAAVCEDVAAFDPLAIVLDVLGVQREAVPSAYARITDAHR